MNIVDLLYERSIGRNVGNVLLEQLIEDRFTLSHPYRDIPLQPEIVLSTIAIALSPNGEFVASTHGDHTVKVFMHSSRECVHVFHGHPRTPWTVKFHPSDSDIVASGCLGCEVRVWSISHKRCMQFVRYDYSIISLSFQPSPGQYIAVASGPKIHMWDWRNPIYFARPSVVHPNNPPAESFAMTTHTRNVRAVIFHPTEDIIFAAAPDPPRDESSASTPCRLYVINVSPQAMALRTQSVALIGCRTLVPQVHLYSDGGLDISKDGSYLFTCAILRIRGEGSEAITSTVLHGSATSSSSNDIEQGFNTGPRTRSRSASGGLRIGSTSGGGLLSSTLLSLGGSAYSAFMRTAKADSPTARKGDAPPLPTPQFNGISTNGHGEGSETSNKDTDISLCLHANSIRGIQEASGSYYTSTEPSSATSPDWVLLHEPNIPLDSRWRIVEHLCLFRLHVNVSSDNLETIGVKLVKAKPLSGVLMKAVTSMKLSPSCRYGIVAYGVRTDQGVVENHANSKVACEVLKLDTMVAECTLTDDVDEVNIAQFHPIAGCGLVYGTKRARCASYRILFTCTSKQATSDTTEKSNSVSQYPSSLEDVVNFCGKRN